MMKKNFQRRWCSLTKKAESIQEESQGVGQQNEKEEKAIAKELEKQILAKEKKLWEAEAKIIKEEKLKE